MCKGGEAMPSNIAYDPVLLEEALKLGGYKYKKDVVNAALKEYVQRYRQRKIFELFGEIDYSPDYDYKRGRKRR